MIDTEIIALSSDTEDDARGSVQALGLGFAVAHSVDPAVMSQTIGTYAGTHQGRPHLQPAAFVIRRDGAVMHAVYSSGKVGRLTSNDVLALLQST